MIVLFSLAGRYRKPYLKFPNTIQTFIQGVITNVPSTLPHTLNLTIPVSYFINIDNKQCAEVQVHVGQFSRHGRSNML